MHFSQTEAAVSQPHPRPGNYKLERFGVVVKVTGQVCCVAGTRRVYPTQLMAFCSSVMRKKPGWGEGIQAWSGQPWEGSARASEFPGTDPPWSGHMHVIKD